jgi:hypothetical protein
MGQRHMTYVMVEDVARNRERAMLALYNQWNYELIQPAKVIRFLTALKQWQQNKSVVECESIAKLYQHAASITPSGLSNMVIENGYYNQTYGMYDEDNNNGWQIVFVKYDSDTQTFDVHVGFKPGYEWGEDYENKGYLPLKEYLDGCLTGKGESGYSGFLADHNKDEQIVLEQINKSFNKDEIERAEAMIRQEIERLQAAKKSEQVGG